ncbi:unnamed protein product [marine sediment metagenome]|uniref:Uncharacterized protein n=1 Tax=marine sediment metagenome TaxID=412755 RepID=X1IM68_9ZZZZ
MRKGKCSVCGQDMFDPLLSEVKEEDSRIEQLANGILNDVLNLIIKYMVDLFPEDEIKAFDEVFDGTEAYYNIRDMISMALMPEEG